METLYEYLLKNYKLIVPIFLADLQIEVMSRANLGQQIKKVAGEKILQQLCLL